VIILVLPTSHTYNVEEPV